MEDLSAFDLIELNALGNRLLSDEAYEPNLADTQRLFATAWESARHSIVEDRKWHHDALRSHMAGYSRDESQWLRAVLVRTSCLVVVKRAQDLADAVKTNGDLVAAEVALNDAIAKAKEVDANPEPPERSLSDRIKSVLAAYDE